MTKKRTFLFAIMLVASSILLYSQSNPVVIEAESGTLGSDYQMGTDGDITYVEQKTPHINTTCPGDDSKVITYNVTFPKAGSYSLFIRLRVGASNFDDDSFFLGKGFGTKSSTTADDWIIINMLAAAGFTAKTDVVNSGGGAGSEVWKWVNLSVFDGGFGTYTYLVEEGNLTQTLQIGARENGLIIDKMIFAENQYFYTVAILDNGLPGLITNPDNAPIGPPLADGLSKFLGCSYGPDSESKFEGYWNQVTPGNGGKWGTVEGWTRDVMNWRELDSAYNLAKRNNFVFRYHVLVWGSQQPAWIADLDSAEQLEEIKEWFAAVAARYPDIDYLEVVNEPLHQPPDAGHEGKYIQALGGSGETGWDWIINAFKLAKQYFPDTKLMINDYGIISSSENVKNLLKIVNLLKADTLIDAIGFQGHGFSLGVTSSTMKANLDSLAASGLPIMVTEMDVDGPTDIKHLQEYQRIFPIFWEHESVVGITLWGFRPAMWRGDQGAYLIDNDGYERPSMKWLRAYLKGTYKTAESITLTVLDGGEPVIENIGGTLQLQASILPDDVTIPIVGWKVSDKKIATIDTSGLLTAVASGTVTVTAYCPDYGSDVESTLDITIGTVDVKNNSLANLSIYPNPSENGVFILKGIESISQIKVYDIIGNQILVKENTNKPSITIELDIPAGLYFIQLFDGQQNYSKKLIVK